MALIVDYGETLDPGEITKALPASWYVRVAIPLEVGVGLGVATVVLDGFARKKDAEIAMQALVDTGINWDATESEELHGEVKRFGGRKAMQKCVGEQMQW